MAGEARFCAVASSSEMRWSRALRLKTPVSESMVERRRWARSDCASADESTTVESTSAAGITSCS